MILYDIVMATDDEVKNQIIVDTINILMSTNIPGQADISLTSKMVVGTSANAAKYNEYPYITRSIAIREGYLRNKSFNDILDYFFIKDIFVKKTNEMRVNKIIVKADSETNVIPDNDEEDEEDGPKEEENVIEVAPNTEKEDETKNELENLKSNIQLLLRMLFDTYPIKGNVASSLERIYTTKLYNLNKYSYLNITGKPYTVSKVVWINDVYNHYTSKQLIKDYKEFDAWKVGEMRNIANNLIDNGKTRENLIKSIKSKKTPLRGNLKDDMEKIQSYLLNLSNWTTKTQSFLTIRNALEILYAHLIILTSTSRTNPTTIVNRYIDELNGKKETIKGDNDMDLKDQVNRLENIINIIKRSLKKGTPYTINNTTDFVTELNRTATVIINSNILPISSGVQGLIKDLNDNNEKRIVLEKNQTLIDSPSAIFGNDKYKDANYKTLTDAISKYIKTIRKIENLKKYKEFNADTVRVLARKIQKPTEPNPEEDESGIIYDNNNVTTPKYEIYLYVDLIEGKITDDNRDNLDLCTFRDELLLIKFNQLRNNEIYTLQHDPLIKMLQPNQGAPNKGVTNKEESKLKVKGGATTIKNRRNCNYHNRTKKYE
jgi:hypothetical protein